MGDTKKTTRTGMDNAKTEKVRNILCFIAFGILSLVLDEMSLIAAQDFLAGSRIATSNVIIAIALPVLIVKLLAPWCIQECSFLTKSVLVVLLFIVGLVVLVTVNEVYGRLVGVSIVESGVSLSEITFLSLTAFYSQVTVSAFVAGIGLSSLVAPLYYTSFTTWFCVAPRYTMMITIPWPMLILVFYHLLDKTNLQSKTTAHDGAQYTAIDSWPQGQEDEISPREGLSSNKLSLCEKCCVAKQISPYILFLFLTYFAEYLSNQSIVTTISLPNAPFNPRDHYIYYIWAYHVGKFLGRSHFLFVSIIYPPLLPYIHIRKTWILSIIAIAHMVVFLLASWYRFVPHVSILLVLCFTEGFTAGSIYVNSAHTVSEMLDNKERRELALALLTLGNACGKLAAGTSGLLIEPELRKHCLYDLRKGEFCYTRYESVKGWTTNNYCNHKS